MSNNVLMPSITVTVGSKSKEVNKIIKLAPEVNYEEVEENTLNNFDEVVYEDFEEKFEAADDLLKDIDEEQEVIPGTFIESITKYQTLMNAIKLAKINGDNESVAELKIKQDEAFEEIFKHYKPILSRLGSRRNDEDLTQELNAVLIKAIETFDSTCGAKFNTYFWKCARNHMGTLNIRKNAKKRTAENGIVSIQQTMVTKGNKDSDVELVNFLEDKAIEADYEDTIFRLTLNEKIYPHLKDSEIRAIEMLLRGYTLEEIGQELGGITAPAVHIKFRRLAEKKVVGKHLKQLYQMYCS